MATDERIIQLCQKGRQEGFALLLDVYQNRVYQRAFTFLRQREDALDATQDVFLRVVNAIEHFRPGNAIWPWLRTITTNICLNRIRSAQSRPQTVSMDATEQEFAAHQPEFQPEQAAIVAWDRELLTEAIDSLPPLHRMVIVLRHEEDLSYDEIARIMQLPLGTVKTYLFRARRTLREVLRKEVG